MGVDEIAKELEVSHRMVKEYKNDLEKAGIYIGSKLGRYGGYYIENRRSFDGLGLTDEEVSALKMAKESIKSGKYHYGPKFETLVSKILNSQSNGEEIHYHHKTASESEDIIRKEKRAWVDVNLAIHNKNRIRMSYKSLKESEVEIRERLVEPYGVFDYKGASYFYGYCSSAKDIRFFKLSRIMEHHITNEIFDIKVDYNFDEVMDKSFGIYTDEAIDLKLNIYYPMSEIIKEKYICKGQKIQQLDDKTIRFEAKMKGYTEIITWVMGMGSSVEVLEPVELKEHIHKEVSKIIELYK